MSHRKISPCCFFDKNTFFPNLEHKNANPLPRSTPRFATVHIAGERFRRMSRLPQARHSVGWRGFRLAVDFTFAFSPHLPFVTRRSLGKDLSSTQPGSAGPRPTRSPAWPGLPRDLPYLFCLGL